MKARNIASVVWLAAFVVTPLAHATEVSASDGVTASPFGFRLVDEVRGGAFVDDAVGKEQRAAMVSFEAISSSLRFYNGPNALLAAFLNPRLDAGAMINTRGLTSYAFAGLNWHVPIYGRFFGEGEFGGAVNNSSDNIHDMTRTDLGCPVTFRESAGLGVEITQQIDVIGSIEHISHANLCSSHNPGLTSVGLRVGYKF